MYQLYNSFLDKPKQAKTAVSNMTVSSDGNKKLFKTKQGSSPKKSLSAKASVEKPDTALFSSGGEDDNSLSFSTSTSGARNKGNVADIPSAVRNSLSPRTSTLQTNQGKIVTPVALKDFGDIDDDDDEYVEDFNNEMGNSSVTDLLGITPRDKHINDSDDSDFFA